MALDNKYTPFDDNIVITLVDSAGEPLPIAEQQDIEVHVFLSGVLKFKYKKDAADGWKTWEDAATDNGNVLICPLTVAETTGWRGLLQTAVVIVKDDKKAEPIITNEFYLIKSGIIPE